MLKVLKLLCKKLHRKKSLAPSQMTRYGPKAAAPRLGPRGRGPSGNGPMASTVCLLASWVLTAFWAMGPGTSMLLLVLLLMVRLRPLLL